MLVRDAQNLLEPEALGDDFDATVTPDMVSLSSAISLATLATCAGHVTDIIATEYAKHNPTTATIPASDPTTSTAPVSDPAAPTFPINTSDAASTATVLDGNAPQPANPDAGPDVILPDGSISTPFVPGVVDPKIAAIEAATNDPSTDSPGETEATHAAQNAAAIAAAAPVATVIASDPATGGPSIITSDPTTDAVLSTPITSGTIPTAGTVVVATDGTPTVDETLVPGAPAVTLGDTVVAHPDIVPPETIVAGDPTANVAVTSVDPIVADTSTVSDPPAQPAPSPFPTAAVNVDPVTGDETVVIHHGTST